MKVGDCSKILEMEEHFSSIFFYSRICTNAKGRCCLPTSLSVVVLYLVSCSLTLPLKSSLIHSANIYKDSIMHQTKVYIFYSRWLQCKCFCVEQGSVSK